jgi:membrane-bound lytic murein transglycosylase B
MGVIMRNPRTVLIAVAGLAVAAVIIGSIILLWGPAGNRSGPGQLDALPAFAKEAPLERAKAPFGAGVETLADQAWVARVAARTGIPARALDAYAGVAITIENSGTGCDIGWNTLAAIGQVESHHGAIFNGTIDANGTVSPPIFGIPLDGGSVANIPDSDKGAIDGDSSIDRAVGPMQLIPDSWRNWHVDANADGVQDPQNIDDATLAAAHYLCRAGGQKLGEEAGWRQAVLAYNSSDQYLRDIIRYATTYLRASSAGSP